MAAIIGLGDVDQCLYRLNDTVGCLPGTESCLSCEAILLTIYAIEKICSCGNEVEEVSSRKATKIHGDS